MNMYKKQQSAHACCGGMRKKEEKPLPPRYGMRRRLVIATATEETRGITCASCQRYIFFIRVST